jgi:biopolymer transport protein ExbD
MRIDAPRRISRPVPLVPLIDVVFLLLMFFMLSTTFSKFGLLGMPGAAQASAAATPAAAARLPGVIVDVSAGPKLRVNGRAVELPELVATLDALQASGSDRGLIRMRKDASVQDMLDVLEVARRSKLRSLALTQ